MRWERVSLEEETEMETRGIRNNNPGNIIKGGAAYQGEIVPSSDSRFRQFIDMAHGYRAMFVLLKRYNTYHKLDTVSKVINRWCPTIEKDTGLRNDTTGYIKFVCEKTGLSADAPLSFTDKETMVKLVRAMSWMECGRKPDEGEIEAGWRLYLNI